MLRHRPHVRRRIDELELHLLRCRRREEAAWVMVARIGGHAAVGELLAQLRLTDSARVEASVHGKDLVCVLDAAGLDREALERRLRAGIRDADVQFGWSHFPEDGAGLDVLLHMARAALPRPLSLGTRSTGAAPAALEVEGQ